MSTQNVIDLARRELLDMGLRGNPLLHYRSNLKSLDVIDELSEQVFDTLVGQGKGMRFLPVPKAYQQDQDDVLLLGGETDESIEPLPPLQEYLAEEVGEKRHEDIFLQTKLQPEPLDRSLLKIESEAHTLLQEQGIEVLYLALGFIEWYEDPNSSTPRYAPLILLPVELRRSTAKESFSIHFTQSDLGGNLALAAKLKGEFRVELPEYDDELNLQLYFDSVSEAISKQPRWKVHQDKIALGLFSFGKFQMFTDLDADHWPEDAKPGVHPLLINLFDKGFAEDAESLQGLSEHRSLREPETLKLVKDADSSQTEAVLAIMQGSNLVIQGPPGTGKSQTITNIISEALARGKKILFVAQKMAALEVVKSRLDECHLGDSVLELHSHKSTKKTVLESIRATFEQGKPQVPDRSTEYKRLQDVRNQLNDYVDAIRKPILKSKINYVQALGRLLKLQKEPGTDELPELPFSLMSDWGPEKLASAERKISAIAEHIESRGVPENNPFSMSERTSLSPVEQRQISVLLEQCQDELPVMVKDAEILAGEMGLPTPSSINQISVLHHAAQRAMQAPKLSGVSLNTEDWQSRRDSLRQLVAAGSDMTKLYSQYSPRFVDQAFDADIFSIRKGLAGRVDKWWRIFSAPYRKAKSNLQELYKEELDGKPTDWLKWVDDLLVYQKNKKAYTDLQALGERLFAAQWQKESSDWNVLSTISEWLFEIYDEIGKGMMPPGITNFLLGKHSFKGWEPRLEDLSQQVTQLQSRLDALIKLVAVGKEHELNNVGNYDTIELALLLQRWERSELLYDAAHFNHLKSELKDLGLEFLNSIASSWGQPPIGLLRCLQISYFSGLVNSAYGSNSAIQRFDRITHERLISEFIDLDSSLFNFAKELLVKDLYEALPNYNAPGEMDLLRRELSKKRRHIAIRRLISESATVIQQAKPVFMMSPMSVATYLPQGKIDFDLVIFDEASQIEAPDALGAIARGRQVVVVGDSKQMPPTNFFGKAVELTDDEAEESATADVESILGMMLSKGVPEVMLRWHYRSRHESLITVSNDQFYNNKLLVFPSPGIHPDATGLQLNYHPDTSYDRGGSRSNIGEAKHIAHAVIEHARKRPHLSLGVVAFSTAQRDAIMLLLEAVRRQNPDIESFFKHHEGGDEFFIKNLENVQGDERDVIFISIGYGRTAAGNVTSSFGPINRSGGERRLNVLISRARMAMNVFCNFTADDMKTKESSPFGVRALKAFLKYAETRELPQSVETGKEADSPFEEEVHAAIESLGYEVEPQVGCSGFFIDLTVRDPDKPGRYILAVECDGATYHSSVSARERDRLRQGVLEGLGWRFHRIWSTDWFRNQDGEVARLKEAIEQSLAYYRYLDHSEAKPQSKAESGKSATTIVRAAVDITSKPATPCYQLADPEEMNLPLVEDFEYLPASNLEQAIEYVLHVEGPIHIAQLTTRLSNAAGFKRSGAKIKNKVNLHTKKMNSSGRVTVEGEFLWLSSQESVSIRDWSLLENSMKKPDLISDRELREAIRLTVQDALSINSEDCISAAYSLLGFKRITAPVKTRMDSIVQSMIADGALLTDGSRIKIGSL